MSRPFVLHTNASGYETGAVLSQAGARTSNRLLFAQFKQMRTKECHDQQLVPSTIACL